MSPPPRLLSDSQASSLLDILSHAETYSEIRDFRDPRSLDTYGPPFVYSPGQPSTAPALQALVSRFLLPLPGLRDLSPEFWEVQAHDVIVQLEQAELSESYDKGLFGTRKTLATAASALIEYLVRGTFARFGAPEVAGGATANEPNGIGDGDDDDVDDGAATPRTTLGPRHYDLRKAEDLSLSFHDFLQQAVYGTSLEDLISRAAQTDKLNEHDEIVRAVHEFVLVNLASLMHFTLILSPKGQYLLGLLDQANKLVPYIVIRNTLKIGNVASMINAMMKVFLAKVSVSSVTNWIGLTQTEDTGMNLMQHIISTVLHWDIKDFESRASKAEKERDAGGKEQLKALRAYTEKSRDEHERLRKESERSSKSIVTVILADANLPCELTLPHHSHALEYLSLHLSIRDRKQIINVLCHSHPDHLTIAIRELVAAYEPVIRKAHQAVDLSDTVGDFEVFLKDMIRMSRVNPSASQATTPTVGDFVQLLKKHQYSFHKFIHQCAKNGKELVGWYLDWAKDAASYFRRRDTSEESFTGAGDLTSSLDSDFAELPEEIRRIILPILDAQTAYLGEMHEASAFRLALVLKSPASTSPAIAKIVNNSSILSSLSRPSSPFRSRPSSPDRDRLAEGGMPIVAEADPGPGAYLSRWQDLLDATVVTPLTPEGPVQHGAHHDNAEGEKQTNKDRAPEVCRKVSGKAPKPDVKPVLDALLPKFRELLAREACTW